jgi:NAD(P)-dependent dehydrogenase (short-subunit alcohol dehydrogenase family)
MPMRVLITGSNRGLGLEFVRQYLEEGWRVYATCRRPAEAEPLRELMGLHNELSIHRLDITIPEDIRSISWELHNVPLDLLINNAGIYLEKGAPGLGCIHYDNWLRTLEVNTLGAVRVTEALLDNIGRSEKKMVIVLSSHMGSIADIRDAGSYCYRSSKAALNAAMQGMAVELGGRQIGVLILHPGGVMTRMGPADGITPQKSVKGMRHIIDGFTLEQSGSFLQYDGKKMPW